MKKIIYKDKDITNNIDILGAIICDNSGGKADTSRLVLSNTTKIWTEYPPIKGDKIELVYNDFKTGAMYIDEFSIGRGCIVIKALATPLDAKKRKNKSWQNISFKQVATELTHEIVLDIEFFNIQDYSYKYLEKKDMTNMEFLNNLCILEGYKLKIFNKKALIYDEKFFEATSPVYSFSESNFIGDYNFTCKNSEIYSSCTIKYEEYEYTQISKRITNAGDLEIKTIKVNNLGEAERFSKNILRYYNKNELTGSFKVNLMPIASGSTVNIIDLGVFDGSNFIEKVEHNLIKNISKITVRKVLEGL